MNNREIKPGSKWRNVHGVVEVRDILDSNYHCVSGDNGYWISEGIFRATHEWVSDPVEKPKVGDWVRFTCGDICMVAADGQRGNPFSTIEMSGLRGHNEYEPCDPPPLVKALDDLVSRCGDIQTLSAGYFLPTGSGASVKAVINEWRAIKSQIGGE